MLKSVAVAGVLFVSLPAFAASTVVQFEPGQWETSMTMSMMGMDIPGEVETECMSADDSRVDFADLSRELAQDGACMVENMQSQPGRITFDISCTEDGETVSGPFAIDHTPTAFTMAGTLGAMVEGELMEFGVSMTSKRVGACAN